MLGTVVDNFAGSAFEIEVEKQEMIGAGFGLTKSWSSSRSGCFYLNRTTVRSKPVNRFCGLCLDKFDVEKVEGKCLT